MKQWGSWPLCCLLVLAAALGAAQPSAWDVRQAARHEHAQGRTAAGVQLLQTLVHTHGNGTDAGGAWFDLGLLSFHAADWAGSRRAFLQAAALLTAPSERAVRAEALTWAGVTHRREGNALRSLDLISRALRLHPDSVEAHMQAALSRSLSNEVLEALRHLMWVVRLERPRISCRTYREVVECLARLRAWDLALRWAQEGVEQCDAASSGGQRLDLIAMGYVAASQLKRADAGRALLNGSRNASAGARALADRVVSFVEQSDPAASAFRQAHGASVAKWRARALTILEQQDDSSPPSNEPSWARECLPAVRDQLGAPEGCYDKLDAFLLRARSAFMADARADFTNPLLQTLACLQSALLSAADCRWAAVVASTRLAADIEPSSGRLRPDNVVYPALGTQDKLRLGIYAGDWDPAHPMQRLIMGFLRGYPRDSVHVTLFYRGASKNPRELQAATELVDAAVSLSKLVGEAAAASMRRQRIQVLLDCTGSTSAGVQDAVERRPAPVVAWWAGFPGTSGSRAVDYVIADRWTVPPALRANTLTERAIYIAGSWLFTDHALHYANRSDFFDPLSRTDGARRSLVRADFGIGPGQMVYGSLNRAQKLDRHMLGAVCEVVRRVPGSVFVQLVVASAGKEELETFWREVCRLAPERLILVPLFKSGKHLDFAACVFDVALDSSLYNGGLTTADLLFAGVPVVTLSGPLHKWTQRMGGSVVRAAGLPELVAADWADYVAIAVRLGVERSYRDQVRAHLLRACGSEAHPSQVLFRPQVGASQVCLGLREAYKRWHSGLSVRDIFLDREWLELINTDVVLA